MSERIEPDLGELFSSIRIDVESLERELGMAGKSVEDLDRDLSAVVVSQPSRSDITSTEAEMPEFISVMTSGGSDLNRKASDEAFSGSLQMGAQAGMPSDRGRVSMAGNLGSPEQRGLCASEILEKLSEIEENLTILNDQIKAISRRSNPIPNAF